MNEPSSQEQAIDLLQHLGLKEYEAKCFVALSRVDSGTAKDVSDISDVPRTRVYDAVRVLESKGLVESQHSNPQRFRAVPLSEAADTLRAAYEARIDDLESSLSELPRVTDQDGADVSHEVWALSDSDAITNRVLQLVDDADEEILFVVGDADVLTEELLEGLTTASDAGVDIIVGTTNNAVREAVEDALPEAEVFVSGLDWLAGDGDPVTSSTEISRLLLVDKSTILVSSREQHSENADEQAVFGAGFTNGLVVVVRRLMSTGLLPSEDPAAGD